MQTLNAKLFELKQAKDEVGGELASILPAAVRRFLATPRFDALVSACILYFVALFQREYLRLAVDKAAKAAGGALAFDAVAVASKLAALQADADAARASLSPLYAQMILQHSSYKHVNRDRLFFEGVYITLINVCDAALHALDRRPDIERALGHLFRGRHFNLYARINQPLRSVDTLSTRELYAVKHETADRALNAKLLAALNARPAELAANAAAVAHSPLVTDYVASVATARALMKDPALRRAKLDEQANAQAAERQLEALVKRSQAPPTDDAARARDESAGEVHSAGTTSRSARSGANAAAPGTPAGDAHGKLYVGPGWEALGALYGERLASLEGLKAYLTLGHHPREEGRRARQQLGHSESHLSSRPSSCGSMAEA